MNVSSEGEKREVQFKRRERIEDGVGVRSRGCKYLRQSFTVTVSRFVSE